LVSKSIDYLFCIKSNIESLLLKLFSSKFNKSSLFRWHSLHLPKPWCSTLFDFINLFCEWQAKQSPPQELIPSGIFVWQLIHVFNSWWWLFSMDFSKTGWHWTQFPLHPNSFIESRKSISIYFINIYFANKFE